MTIEITKESHLTPQGEDLKNKLKDPNTRVTFSISVGPHEFIIKGMGHSDLILTHSDDIVIRKSNFICPRTLAVKCDKASDMLPREMVSLLQNPKTIGTFTIIVE